MPVCPVCGAADCAPRWKRRWVFPDCGGRSFGYLRCRGCGLIFADPIPTEEELEALYGRHYGFAWFAKRARLKAVQAWHRWRRVRRLAPGVEGRPLRVLDVGCGHGHFLAAAKASGAEVVGVEVSEEVGRSARERYAIPVFRDPADLPADSAGGFDMVTLWHVLEHMTAPEAFLRRLSPLLSPGGVLVVAVPNARSIGLRVCGSRWVWCQAPYIHVRHYTPDALENVLARAGFAGVEFRTRETWDAQLLWDGAGMPLQGLLYLASGAASRLGKAARVWGGGATATPPHAAREWVEEAFRLGCFACRYPLLPIFLPLEAAGLGGELLAVARRGGADRSAG